MRPQCHIEWEKANREYRNEYFRKYYEQNIDRKREYYRNYYNEHREAIIACQQLHRYKKKGIIPKSINKYVVIIHTPVTLVF